MSDKQKNKAFPGFKSDEEAERFVESANLSDYDFSDMKPMRFEFAPKAAQINMRVPPQLLDAVKAAASRAGMPYQRYIRQVLESAVTRDVR